MMKDEQLDFLADVGVFRKELLKLIGNPTLSVTPLFIARTVIARLVLAEGGLLSEEAATSYEDLALLTAAVIDRKKLDADFFTEVIRQGDCYFEDPEPYMIEGGIKGVPLLQMAVGYACAHHPDYREASRAVDATHEAKREQSTLM